MKFKIKAGDYFVGDPCYAFNHSTWSTLVELTRFDQEIVHAKAGSAEFTSSRTAFGDGVYLDQYGKEYPVDAGMIGVVPVSAAEHSTPYGMHRVTFTEDFVMDYEDGVIVIGSLVIPTVDESEDENFCESCGIEINEWSALCENCEESEF